jgi:hypothetical protein
MEGIIRKGDQTHREAFCGPEVPTGSATGIPAGRRTLNWRSRVGTMTGILFGNQTEPALFNVACVCAEIHFECGKPTLEFAQQMLEASCPKLIRSIGIAEVRHTIANAFARIANKLKEPQS